MCLTEFDQETYERNMKQEYLEEGEAKGRAEGREEGRVEGVLQNMISLVKDGLLDLSVAASRLNMTIDEFQSATVSYL